jgi:hypothetical protein
VQAVSGFVWASSASVEVVAPRLVADGSHQIVTGGAVSSYSGTYTASLGSDVFIAYSTANAVTVTAITYNSVAMTLVSTVPHNNAAGVGFLSLYRAAAAGTGSSAPFSVTLSAIQHGVMDIFSYSGVASLGTVTTSYGSTQPSIGPITGNPGERILAVLGGGALGTSLISSPVGGTNRAIATSSIGYAQIAVSDSVGYLGSSFFPPTTFSATFQNAHNYSGIAVPLIPYTQQQTIFSTAGTFTYTAPAWARRFEVAALGGGASGDVGGAGFNTGAGGGASSWGTITWERGTDVRVGNETFTVVVGNGGAGPASFGTRQPGGDSTVTALSGASLIVFGGITYNRLDTGHGQTGDAATGITFGGFALPGGTGGAASGGNAGVYGSGGGGGNGVFAGSTAGGSGSRGYVSIVAYAD